MSLVPFLLVVAAAFIHATWNLLAKRAASAGVAFLFVSNVFACTAYLPWVIWLLATREQIWTWPVALCLVVGAGIHLCYSLCLMRGYQVADLSVVYPIDDSSGPVPRAIG